VTAVPSCDWKGLTGMERVRRSERVLDVQM
jgi:hypothetical protein